MSFVLSIKKLGAAVLAALGLLAGGWASASAAGAPGRVVFGFPDASGVRVGPRSFYGAAAVTALPDGRIVVAGQRPTRNLVVAQLTAQGAPDQPFGVSGFAWPSLPAPVFPLQVLVQPDGRLLVVASTPAMSGRGLPDFVLVRLNANGKGDATFGQGGVVVLRGIQAGCGNCQPAALAPDGSIVLAAITPSQPPAIERSREAPPKLGFTVVRLTPEGTLDPTFGQGGKATVPGGGLAEAVAVQPDGAVVVSGVRGDGPSGDAGLLTRLTPSGAADSTFAGGIPVQTPFAGPRQLLVQPNGSVLALGADGTRGALARYTSGGSLDTSYGDQGVVSLTDTVQGATSRLLSEPDGGALVVAGPGTASVSNDVLVPAGGAVVVIRLGPDGHPDPSFGGDTGGGRVGLPFGGGDLSARGGGRLYQNTFDPSSLGAVAQRADGSLVLAGEVHVAASTGKGTQRFISRPAVAALTTGFALDPTFGGGEILRIVARVPPQLVRVVPTKSKSSAGITVGVRASEPGLALITVRARRRVIARGTVPLFIAGAQRVKVLLTAYGKRVVARSHRVRVSVRVAARDLAANTAFATATGTIGLRRSRSGWRRR